MVKRVVQFFNTGKRLFTQLEGPANLVCCLNFNGQEAHDGSVSITWIVCPFAFGALVLQKKRKNSSENAFLCC